MLNWEKFWLLFDYCFSPGIFFYYSLHIYLVFLKPQSRWLLCFSYDLSIRSKCSSKCYLWLSTTQLDLKVFMAKCIVFPNCVTLYSLLLYLFVVKLCYVVLLNCLAFLWHIVVKFECYIHVIVTCKFVPVEMSTCFLHEYSCPS